LLQREQVRRELAKTVLAVAARHKRQIENSRILLAEITLQQSKCPHVKGGKVRYHALSRADYNVTTHTFADGHMEIRCVICGKEWSKANGNLVEGLNLAQLSTNTASSTEQVFTIKDQLKPKEIPEYMSADQVAFQQGPMSPWLGPKWIDIWAKRLKQLNRKKKKI